MYVYVCLYIYIHVIVQGTQCRAEPNCRRDTNRGGRSRHRPGDPQPRGLAPLPGLRRAVVKGELGAGAKTSMIVYECMHICIYIYVYTSLHTYMYVYIYRHVYTHTCAYICI